MFPPYYIAANARQMKVTREVYKLILAMQQLLGKREQKGEEELAKKVNAPG